MNRRGILANVRISTKILRTSKCREVLAGEAFTDLLYIHTQEPCISKRVMAWRSMMYQYFSFGNATSWSFERSSSVWNLCGRRLYKVVSSRHQSSSIEWHAECKKLQRIEYLRIESVCHRWRKRDQWPANPFEMSASPTEDSPLYLEWGLTAYCVSL